MVIFTTVGETRFTILEKEGAFLFFLFAAYWLRISLQSDCRIGVLCSLQSGQGASHHEDGPYSFPGFKYTSSGYVHE